MSLIILCPVELTVKLVLVNTAPPIPTILFHSEALWLAGTNTVSDPTTSYCRSTAELPTTVRGSTTTVSATPFGRVRHYFG